MAEEEEVNSYVACHKVQFAIYQKRKGKRSMKLYDLFEGKMIEQHITLPKYAACVFLAISVVLLVISYFYQIMIYFSLIIVFVTLLILAAYYRGKKRYGNRIAYKTDRLEIYDINNTLLYSLRFCDLCMTTQVVLFDGPRSSFIKKECLILYSKHVATDIYAEMEYRSYCTDRSMVFIENPQLIVLLNSILNESSIS